MPPRRRVPTPIPIDIEAVRRKLAEGKIVRVGISRSAQFPEGGTGRVRHVGDPAVDGEEYVQVELSLNGTRDILPFTPADLTPATRTKAAPPAEVVHAANAVQPATRPKRVRPPSIASAPRSPASASPAVPAQPPPGTARGVATPRQSIPMVAAASPVRAKPTDPAVIASTIIGPTITAPTGLTGGAGSASGGEPERGGPPTGPAPSSSSGPEGSAASRVATGAARAKGPRSPRRSPPVSITIATTETEPTQWRIEARVGARVVLRSGSVSPARVWELVRQLEDPTLITAVGGILDEQRKAAQARADSLAAELAQVRAELEALPRNP